MNFFHMQVKNTPRIACLEQVNINRSVYNNREKYSGCDYFLSLPRNSLDLDTWKIVCIVYTMKFVWSIRLCMYMYMYTVTVTVMFIGKLSTRVSMGMWVKNEQNRILYGSFY